jgi:hypothetical protein
MIRTLFAAIGVVELLRPDALVTAAERVALENPEECERRWWVPSAVRAEGVALLYLALRGEAHYPALKQGLGVVGLLALASPHGYIDRGTALVYADADRCDWKSWVYPATRLTGLCYVLVALAERRADANGRD